MHKGELANINPPRITTEPILIQNGLTPSEIFFYRFVLAYICMWSISRKKFFANSIKDEFLLLLAGLCGGTIYFLTEKNA